MAGVSHAALLLGHLSAHRRAASAALLDRKVSKAAGFTVKAVRLEGDGFEVPSHRLKSTRQLLEQQPAQMCQQPLEAAGASADVH